MEVFFSILDVSTGRLLYGRHIKFYNIVQECVRFIELFIKFCRIHTLPSIFTMKIRVGFLRVSTRNEDFMGENSNKRLSSEISNEIP